VPGQHGRRPAWAPDQFAAAVGADAMQLVLRAVCAEGALVGADAGFGGVGRKVAVAAFTAGAQRKHGDLLGVGR